MMKHLLLSLLFSVFVSGASAQDINALFVSMPDPLIPQLQNAWRKDLIDLYNSGKEAKLKNAMNGSSVLSKLTDDYLLLHVTERSTVEMKLLPLVNNTHIICVVKTVHGPVADSHVEFFTTNWMPLESTDLFMPVSKAWFMREDADKHSAAYLDAVSLLDLDLVCYALSADSLTLTATYTTPQYLNSANRERVLPFLKELPKVYTWEKSQFK